MTRTLEPHRMAGHHDRLYRAARAMCRTPEDAADLVQDTYVRLLGNERRITGDDELGYLLTALRNTHINRARAAARRPRNGGPVDDLEHELADTRLDSSTADQVRAREVMGWVRSLPDDLREAVIAVDVVGLTRAEAAGMLAVSGRVLDDRLARARISLGRRLAPERQLETVL